LPQFPPEAYPNPKTTTTTSVIVEEARDDSDQDARRGGKDLRTLRLLLLQPQQRPRLLREQGFHDSGGPASMIPGYDRGMNDDDIRDDDDDHSSTTTSSFDHVEGPVRMVDHIMTAADYWEKEDDDDTRCSLDGTNENDDDDDDNSVATSPEAKIFARLEDLYTLSFDNVEVSSDDDLVDDETDDTTFDLPVIPVYHSGVHEIITDNDDDNHSLISSFDFDTIERPGPVIGIVNDITTAADWDEMEEDDTWFSLDGTRDDDDDDSVSTAPEATTFAHFEDMYYVSAAFDNVEAFDDNLLDETNNTFDLPVIPIYHSGVHEITDNDDDHDDDHSSTTSDSEASDDDDDQEEKDFVDILALVGLLQLDWNECTGEIINDEKVTTCKELLEGDISVITFDKKEASEDDDLEEKDYFDMLVGLLNLDWNESAGEFNNENATYYEELLEDDVSIVTFDQEASEDDPEWKDYFDLLVRLAHLDETPEEEITNQNTALAY
jgi:hypothetical protein